MKKANILVALILSASLLPFLLFVWWWNSINQPSSPGDAIKGFPINKKNVEYTLSCGEDIYALVTQKANPDGSWNRSTAIIGSASVDLEQFCGTQVNVHFQVRKAWGESLCKTCSVIYPSKFAHIDIDEIHQK